MFIVALFTVRVGAQCEIIRIIGCEPDRAAVIGDRFVEFAANGVIDPPSLPRKRRPEEEPPFTMTFFQTSTPVRVSTSRGAAKGMMLAASVVIICEGSSLGQPVQKYDRLTVVAQRADLMIGTQVVGVLHRGDTFAATEIRNGWYWVSEIGSHGWVRQSDAMPIDRVIRFFSQTIRQNPTAADYAIRGRLCNMKVGRIAGAIADFTEAIRLDPSQVELYRSRHVPLSLVPASP